MQLTEDDLTTIRQWLQSRLKGGLRCFVCGSTESSVLPSVAMTSMFDIRTGRIHYMDGYPLIGLQCTTCANVIWFSAITMGLWQPPVVVSADTPSSAAPAGTEPPASAQAPASTDAPAGAE